MTKKMLSMLLILTMVLTACVSMSGVAFAADQMNRTNLAVSVDGKEAVTVKGYNASYTYNLYVNMQDF